MAINHTTLTAAKTTDGSIKNWVNRSDIPVTNILLEAEAWIYSYMRVREMHVNVAVTFSSTGTNSNTYDLSGLATTFLDPIQFKPYEWGCTLPYMHEADFADTRDSDGNLTTAATPGMYTIIGTDMHVDIDLTADFSGILRYYGQPAALSGSNETNFVTVKYPTMLRYACMAFAYEHMKDTVRAREYREFAMNKIMEANTTNELYRRGQDYRA